ncbi:MAG: 2,5-didehydrogluconate reductase [Phyllobacteriaceae bacterium]|nr:2,5-didehydrogluconate reductase [Phyllobacteriaceae bacterium]MBA92940.1 2,5-didehydrogluconate reductase [Phyllobacteriaceae bacterium]
MHRVEAKGAAIPAIGMGTWTLEGDHCAGMVAEALRVGYRHVDTAAMYRNEEAVGEGLRASGLPREDYFLTTKVWFTDIGDGDLQRSAEASLKRLGVDQVDLFLIHWPNPAIPLADSIRALNAVKSSGMTRHIGVSNFTTPLLAQAIELSEAPLVCNQVEHHPYLNQEKMKAMLAANGMAMTSYCPLYRGGTLFEEPAVRDAAAAHGRTPGQVVLRWHVQQKGVIAIPRTSRPERLAENLAVFDFALSEEEMAAISALRDRNERICNFDFSPVWDAA